jgi:hypothetical protein
LSEVLRCFGDSLLESSLFGLDIADCARLAAVDREIYATVAANPCWHKALSALEKDFELVPLEEPDEKGDICNEWRRTVGEPRYDVEHWDATSTMRRFGLLVSFAQATVGALRHISLQADKDWWHYPSLSNEDDLHKHLNHIQDHFPERYEIAVKLAIANVAELGFHEHGEPYYIVDMSLNLFFAGMGSSLGVFCSSFRDWMCELTYCADCGTDDHLENLNDPTNCKLTMTESTFGMKLCSSLRVLPPDMDPIGRELHGCASGEDWRSVRLYVSADEWASIEVEEDSD